MNHQIDTATLLRMAADNELSPEQLELLEAHLAAHPADQPRIDFDRSLRAACSRTMALTEATASDSLLARVQTVIAESAQEQLEGEPAAQVATETATSQAPAPAPIPMDRVARAMPRPSMFESLLAQWWMRGVAAVLLAALSIWFFKLVLLPSANPSVAVASFVTSQHETCAIDEGVRANKLRMTDLNELPELLAKIVGRPVSIPDIVQLGFTFQGAGRCAVPGNGRSAHLLFQSPPGTYSDGTPRAPAELSLFVQADKGDLAIDGSHTFTFDNSDNELVLVWKSDGLLYYLVSECPVACKKIRDAWGAPTEMMKLIPASK